VLRAPLGARGGDEVGHHRFKATFEVIVKEQGNTNTAEPDPMPTDLVTDVVKEIRKGKPKKGGQQYEIESVTQV
jgi:hypothetical protein